MIDLTTLDVDKIQQELENFKSSGSIYHLVGSNRFFKSLGANSCSGLAFDLLHKGGIQKLVSRRHLIRDYIITTPNNLVKLVMDAKQNELYAMNNTTVPPTTNVSSKK